MYVGFPSNRLITILVISNIIPHDTTSKISSRTFFNKNCLDDKLKEFQKRIQILS